MKNANDSSALPLINAEETTYPSKRKVPSSLSSSLSPSPSSRSSFSSDLVTRTKLLTREEECTLKTALAFVVIKARAKAKAKERAATKSGSSNAVRENENDRAKKQRTTESSDTSNDGGETKNGSGVVPTLPSPSSRAYDSSILDHLFCRQRNTCNNGNGNERRFLKPYPSTSLQCTGGRNHIDYMFKAAKTLAETWLVTYRNQRLQREQSPSAATAINASMITTKALAGATGHLAHQLQLLLVTNDPKNTKNGRCHKSTANTASVTQSSLAKPKKGDSHAMPRMRYRRPSLSSKSAVDSISTPSSSSRTGSAAVVVTPATNHGNSNRNRNNNRHNSSNENENENDTDSNGDKTNQNTGAIGAGFLVQEWIRSTLLEEDDRQKHDIGTAANTTHATTSTTTTTTNAETKVFTTILSCKNTTVLDVLASFHVYTVMIPQMARISPPLVGHIFQVVARLVEDLYGDKISVVGGDADLGGGGDDGEPNVQTIGSNNTNAGHILDHLATSALELLELCWTTEITIGSSARKVNHRSFLLLSLQEILGDLLVPLSRQELAGEHYRLTVAAHRHTTFQQQQQRVRQNFLRSSEPQNHRKARQPRFVLQRGNKTESSPHGQTVRKLRDDHLPLTNNSSVSARGDTGNEKDVVSAKFQASRASPPPKPKGFIGGFVVLDPEAKLLLRMAVYRLILVGTKG